MRLGLDRVAPLSAVALGGYDRQAHLLAERSRVVLEVRRFRIVSRDIIGLHEPTDGNDGPIVTTEEPVGLRKCDRHFHKGAASK